MANLKNILAGKNDNHILPFLWMRDQEEEVLRTEIEKIYADDKDLLEYFHVESGVKKGHYDDGSE